LVAWALHLLGLAAHIACDYPTARTYYEQSLVIRRRLGFVEGIAVCGILLGMITYREGDYVTALGITHDALLALRQAGLRWTVHNALATCAGLAAMLQQPGRAVRLAGAIASFGESIDVAAIPLAEEMVCQALDTARQALGEADYQAAWAEGRALSLDQAIDEALRVQVPATIASVGERRASAAAPSLPVRAPLTAAPRPAALSPREAAVLRLIAAGRTTREMANELFVSVATIERHITHLYGKIDARGRADATAYALRCGLA